MIVLAMALAGCQSAQQVEAPPAEPEPVMEKEPTPEPPKPAALPPSEPEVDPEQVRYEQLLSIRTLYFDFDRSELRSSDQEVVAAHARFLSENPNTRIRLEGHADERGSREYNIGLGERRAQTVRRTLALQGVGADQLATRSFGEEKPVDPGHTESAWQLNRRVELVYY